MIQSLQTNNEQLVVKINTMERHSISLTEKSSMLKGAETLSERIHAADFNNQNLLKSYDKLTDKLSLQEGNKDAIKIISKDESLSLLDKFHTLELSMRVLEQNTEQEIQTLQKAVVKRFEKIDEFIETDEQEQKIQK